LLFIVNAPTSQKPNEKEYVTIIINEGVRKKQLDLSPNLNTQLKKNYIESLESTRSRPPLNSPDFAPGNVPMDMLLTGTDYVLRVRDLVQPLLKRLLDQRMRELRHLKQKPRGCSTELFMEIDAMGNYVAMTQTKSCESDSEFNVALLRAFQSLRGLPPPPSNLLENGKVELIWGLTVR
jgi:hypothetical protein